MLYNLVLVIYLSLPQTVVSLYSGLTYAQCDTLKVEWVVPVRQGKVVCLPAREGWNNERSISN